METCKTPPRQVLVINVGDELLDGLRENGHLLWLGEHLARRGLPISRSLVVRDDATEIARAIGEGWGAYDLIVTTGGIGPTSDDHTREAVAAALGVGLRHVPAAESALRERFALIGRKVAPADLSQCYVPEGGESLPNPRGTAPGVFFHRGRTALAMLPGPSLELRPMFEDEVVPRLRGLGCACQGEAYVQVRTFGLGVMPLEAKGAAPDLTPTKILGNFLWPDDKTSSTPEPDLAKGIWFARDVAPMAEALQTEPILVVLRQASHYDPRLTPVPVDTSGIKNDHREYAITWFMLAAVWTVMSLWLIIRIARRKE